MYKNKSKWTGIVLALLMILVFTTPIFAQGEVDPVGTPDVDNDSSNIYDHPIVKWIVKFLFNPTIEEEEPKPEVGGADLIGEEPLFEEGPLGGGDSTEGVPELIPVIVPEEVVAAMHEDEKLGFGEIVKILEIAENAQAACVENNGENCEITLGSLLIEYKNGAGMGDLFEKYGKPENLGVGQIREESNPNNKEKSNNGNGAAEPRNTGAGDEQADSNKTLPQRSDPKDKEKSNNGKAKEKDNIFYPNIAD